ncbi:MULTISPECIES: DNA polymerase III subunit alpha [unclassified Pseudoalteromonas]|uniref:DNA polymerase III subunit alpha n=1 Tax=unclassified Pseudoalteromonas TaxID=194690 RepID=UPI002359A2DD|nr:MULTISPECIES: DNA polymerase III subunit alpha [unclassified Pseudoalteromonas]MDC9564195.1 DNA polymerase III subunit alpha [Pseudoalteromonas sp. GAB2316C]MDC9568652.1 DNA polymerase III subunit alpha [Pseudoalteromonas sp. GABNB9D]MDC9572584.1 DNA polymerase III subunit alpha [Pseudoalteromonas sp. GABNS16A]MDC9576734.1 DNA polymerase III subunit alpha [Pseudoalteromonas sp. GABNS16E]MDC9584638.1 DNA polymerase III subunit alpha [Pseudoalteromonas sp. GABNS16C]
MAAPDFVHLRVHSDFSMVDGLAKTKPIVAKAQELGMPALAITDQMNFCGLVRFYGATHSAGIKPIVGADFWLRSPEFPDEPSRITLLAKNNDGYKNITLLISEAYQRGHIFHRPVIDREWLVKHKEGLIILSGAKDGDLGKALLKNNPGVIESVVSFYKQHFSDHYYLELIRTDRPLEEDYLHMAVELAAKEQLPVVATNEVVFLKPENFEAHEIRVAIFDGYTLDDKRRPKRFSQEQYLKTPEQMAELFSDIPEALQNTVEIAKRCNVTVQLGTYFLPDYPTGSLKIEDFLVKVSEDGLEERLQFLFPDEQERQEKRGEYDERLKVELGVINQMGFPGYFLIVMEFIQWSKDNNIPVGPGRGSGAGSLVAYALKITDLDPLEFDLLFERFLNPERVSMPDFDVDFCMDRRDEVIDHVSALYGRDAVSQIITFGTMAAKAVIRDVGRVLGHPYGFVERISKLIPGDPGMTLAKAFEVEPRLQEAYDGDSEVKDLIDMCRILEGCTRNAGKHAGGVVISPTTITDFAALYCDDEGKFPVTQFDKNDVETAGLVKFDFLGLRTLTILQWAVDMTNERMKREGKAPVDINTIPLDDKKSIELLLRAETTAVFQLESRGMKDLVRRLKPDCFEDMIALVALFRPGPLQSGMVDNFIDRKLGREEISYPDAQYQHESLKPILEPTYGIILYQEQVMQIAQVLAGYTLGGADMLRRAMGKKKPEEMAKQRSTFEEGARNNGIDGELAIKIFDLVEKFAGYGFNKSHSAAYALVSYQTLWMKTHHPAEFMAAVMSADMDNTDKIVILVDECENMKLTLLPPDVNAGEFKFTVNLQGEIVYGIGAIKGVGEAPVEAILEARAKGGPFKDLFDFCARVDLKRLNKRVTEKLIYAGALDQLGPEKTQAGRATLLASLKDAMRAADQHNKAEQLGQSDLFGLLAIEPDEVEQAFIKATPLTDNQWLDGEKDTLGLYLTGHPINQYRRELRHYTSGKLVDLQPTNRDVLSTAAGLVISARTLINKKGNRWGLITLDDKSARIDVRLFPEQFEMYQEMLQVNNILVISGQVSFDNFSGGITMTAREINTIAQAREKRIKAIKMTLNMVQIEAGFFDKLQKVLEPYKMGTCPIKVYYQRPDALAQLTLGIEWCVTPSDDLIHKLSLMAAQDVELEFN